jgi:hypothetical protein
VPRSTLLRLSTRGPRSAPLSRRPHRARDRPSEPRRDELLVEYRSPESILVSASPMRTLLRFRELPDRPAIELA